MSARDRLAARLRPLSDAMWKGHCWIRTANGPRRIDKVFDEVCLSEHVMGSQAYGLCPIEPGTSTTRVACLDFDSHKGETPWSEMMSTAKLVADNLTSHSQVPHLFRSSGGSGIHLYLLWLEPQDAFSVRELLADALEDCGLKPGTKGVAAGDVEVFPKQDAVPVDGYGSMFVLPFHGKSEPLGEFDGWDYSAPVPLYAKPERPELSVTETPPDLERLKSALDAIPNSGTKELSYDDWRNIIFGIHHATGGSDEGLNLAHVFSSRASKYDPDVLDRTVWAHIRSDRAGPVITERTIYHRASRDYGWQDPAIVDEFDIIEDAAESVPTAETKAPRFKIVDGDEFRIGKPQAWLIKGVLPQAELAVIYGASKSGKSFLALDMAFSIALGEPWRDRKVKQGNVLYIAAEGSQGVKGRLSAAVQQLALPRCPIKVLPAAPNFLNASDIEDVLAAMKEAGPFDVIFVDTLARVLVGDENSSEDMGLLIRHCQKIHRATGALVVLIHHSGKDGAKGTRGSSALPGAVDVEIEVVRHGENDRSATITRAKDGADGDSFGFRLKAIDLGTDEDDEHVTSCVVEHTQVPVKEMRKKHRKLQASQETVLQAVIDLQGLDSEGATAEDLIAEAASHMDPPGPGKQDNRRRGASRALQSLEKRGRVVSERGRYRLSGENERAK